MQRSADTNADRNLPTFEPPVQAQAQPFVPAPLRGTVHIFPSSHSLPSPHCIFSLSLSTHTHYIVFAQAEVEKQALKDGTLHKVEGAATTETTPTATAIPYKRKNLLPGMKNRVMVQDDVPRDQGFARPTVLILVPMRNIAGRVRISHPPHSVSLIAHTRTRRDYYL